MEVWDGKIRRVDMRMGNLQELASKLEENGEKSKRDFKKVVEDLNEMFSVPGVIGPRTDGSDAYPDLKAFIQGSHERGQDTLEKLFTKMKDEEKRANKLVADLKEDLLEYMKLQEIEISNLRSKVNQIDEEMEGLLNENGDVDDDDVIDEVLSPDVRPEDSESLKLELE